MTDQSPAIRIHTRRVIAQHLLQQIINAAEGDRIAAVAACDGALEILAPKTPEAAPFWGGCREDASWWAEFASDTMRSAMLGAILKHMETNELNSTKAKKRALAALHNSLDDSDKAAFQAYTKQGEDQK